MGLVPVRRDPPLDIVVLATRTSTAPTQLPIPNKGSVPLSQHFFLSPAARTLSLTAILRMNDAEAFAVFQRIRFAANDGNPFCPTAVVVKVYTLAEPRCAGNARRAARSSRYLRHDLP